MIIGIGLDMVEISRIEQIVKRQSRFPTRILTTKELAIFQTYSGKRQVEFLAGRFAAKEAYAKANGTGIGEELSFLDIEIIPDEKGKPVIANQDDAVLAHLAITHTKDMAAAQVVLEKRNGW